MAVLCICGICIPYSVLWPLVLVFLKQIWGFIFPSPKKKKGESTEEDEPKPQVKDHMGVLELKPDMDWNHIIRNDKTTIAKFTATWCKPCNAINPFYEKMSEKYGSDANFYSIDVDENDEVAAENGAVTIPLFVSYRNGEVLRKLSGKGEDQIEAFIEDSLRKD